MFVLGLLIVGIALVLALRGKGIVGATLDNAVTRIATAIARFETGYHKRGAGFVLDARQWEGAASRNKNPGNLRYIGQAGAVGVDPRGFAVFSTEQAGWDALRRDVTAKLTGATRTGLGPLSTLAQFISVYAPSTENPTAAYIAFVARELGVDANARFSDWIPDLQAVRA